jgi:RNA polymerase sigma factor (TIGR02999 family)
MTVRRKSQNSIRNSENFATTMLVMGLHLLVMGLHHNGGFESGPHSKPEHDLPANAHPTFSCLSSLCDCKLGPMERRILRQERSRRMNEVTEILRSIAAGEREASGRLLPFVYEELRRLAAVKMAREPSGQTLQPTALVHEAFLRLVDGAVQDQWNSQGHFFGAAAEAMRRILVDNARRKNRVKHGGELKRVEFNPELLAGESSADQILAVHDALSRLEEQFPDKAEVVKLRYFAGLSNAEAAEAMGVGPATAQRYWQFARTWLFQELNNE